MSLRVVEVFDVREETSGYEMINTMRESRRNSTYSEFFELRENSLGEDIHARCSVFRTGTDSAEEGRTLLGEVGESSMNVFSGRGLASI